MTRYGPLDFKIAVSETECITFEIGDRISLPPGGLSVAPPLPPGHRILHALTSAGLPLAIDSEGTSVSIGNLPVTATLFLGPSNSPALAWAAETIC
jgi:hypothetical protein